MLRMESISQLLQLVLAEEILNVIELLGTYVDVVLGRILLILIVFFAIFVRFVSTRDSLGRSFWVLEDLHLLHLELLIGSLIVYE